MPIFDDPKKSLERMQRQLLQEEEYEEEYLTEEEWFDEELAEARALLEMDEEEEEDEDEALYRNFANGYGQYRAPRAYDELEEEEKPARPAKGRNSQLMLTFLLLAGIVAVAIYWVAVLL